MIFSLLAAWLLPALVAWLLVSLAIPLAKQSLAGLILRAALCVPLTVGIGSVAFYIGLLSLGAATRAYVVAETAGLTLLAFALAVARRSRSDPPARPPHPAGPRANFWLVAAVLTLAALALTTLIAEARAAPHGNWDASSIWNLRARFLHRGGDHWARVFDPRIGWSHPDYPLLVPAAVARSWLYFGSESQLAPAAISIASTMAVVALLASAVATLRDSTLALLAALALLATDPLIRLGADQYADIPLAALMLAATTTLCISLHSDRPERGPALLVGLLVGFACWTKNEGIVFAAVLVLVLLIRAIRSARDRTLAHVLIGLLPMALLIAHFKLRFAPPNDLFADSTPAELVRRLLEPRRHLLAAPRFAWSVLSFGKGIPVVLLAGATILGRRPRTSPALAWLPGTIAAAMLAIYYMIFVVTPQDIAWHINHSATRLLLQIYPIALLAGLLSVASPCAPAMALTSSPTPSPSP